jgi:hypothetical protein
MRGVMGGLTVAGLTDRDRDRVARQGSYRMRGVGNGQTIDLLVIPEARPSTLV